MESQVCASVHSNSHRQRALTSPTPTVAIVTRCRYRSSPTDTHTLAPNALYTALQCRNAAGVRCPSTAKAASKRPDGKMWQGWVRSGRVFVIVVFVVVVRLHRLGAAVSMPNSPHPRSNITKSLTPLLLMLLMLTTMYLCRRAAEPLGPEALAYMRENTLQQVRNEREHCSHYCAWVTGRSSRPLKPWWTCDFVSLMMGNITGVSRECASTTHRNPMRAFSHCNPHVSAGG